VNKKQAGRLQQEGDRQQHNLQMDTTDKCDPSVICTGTDAI